jgi:hypothetical protein
VMQIALSVILVAALVGCTLFWLAVLFRVL